MFSCYVFNFNNKTEMTLREAELVVFEIGKVVNGLVDIKIYIK